MPTSRRLLAADALKLLAFLLCAALLASAQAAPALAAPQTAAASSSSDDKIRDLEDRIIALENEVRTLKEQAAAHPAGAPAGAAQPSQAAATGAAPESTSQAAQQGESEAAAQPAQQPTSLGGATSMAKALNPDIAMIGNFIGTTGHNDVAGIPSLQMRESELSVQAVIDPYARADFFLSFGEEGVSLEEGYATFTALPAGFVVKAGKMRSAFGKVNTMHSHVLPWIDRPVATDNLVGGEDGIDDAGFSITRSFAGPKDIFLEATGQIFRGDSDGVFVASRNSDVSTVAHLRGYKDITESTNLDIGLSYARGHNDLGSAFVTSLYGVDATLRWKPLRRAIYRSFLARSEFFWSQRQQFPVEQRAFGFYASADYQFARRWTVGGRYDLSDRATNAALTDKGGSFVVTYRPTEFSQLRWQYRYVNYAEGTNGNELRFQVMFAIGAHGAHPF